MELGFCVYAYIGLIDIWPYTYTLNIKGICSLGVVFLWDAWILHEMFNF